MTGGIRDVAAAAGVSVGTVSNVLNRPDRVGADTVARVHRAIADLGFVRNDAARQLRAGRSRTVALVVLDVRNPFFTELARGAEHEADRRGLAIVLGNSDEDHDRESRYLDLFEQQRVRGILLSPLGAAPRLREMRERGTPTVLVDRSSADASLSSVSVDDVRGGMLAVGHLVGTGRRRIAFVGGPGALQQVADRRRGAELAVAGTSAVLEVVDTAGLAVAHGRAAGDALATRPPADRPDAVFAANDLIALGVLQSFAIGGIRVPGDIALIGFDDIDFAAAAVVPLSSIRQPAPLMGETALRILVEESEDPSLAPRRIVFEPELVVRASTV